jgi:hypothetical protein
MKFLLVSLGILSAASQAKAHDTVYFNIQCWSEGNNFRVQDSPREDYISSTRLFLDLKVEGEHVVLSTLFGHVSGAKFVEGRKETGPVDFYTQVYSKNLVARPNPKSRIYKDASYWKFSDISGSQSTHQDGGHFEGALALSKKIDAKNFRGHLIFRHGDHTGGTMDLTCEKR